MTLQRFFCYSLFSLFFVLLAQTPISGVQAQMSGGGNGWDRPISLGEGWWNSISVDRSGRVHIGWYHDILRDTRHGYDLLMYRSRSFEGEWTPLLDVQSTGSRGFTVRNASAVTPNGRLFYIHRRSTPHYLVSVPVDTAQDVRTWSEPLQMGDGGYYTDMTISQNGVLHLLTSEHNHNLDESTVSTLEQNPCAACSELIYRRSDDNGHTWSTGLNLSNTLHTGSDRIRVREAVTGRMFIEWDEGYDWYTGRGNYTDLRFVYSDDDGLTWSEPVILTGEYADGRAIPSAPAQFALTQLLDGTLMAVWRYAVGMELAIYYQLSQDMGQTWTDPEPVPNLIAMSPADSILDDYELVTDHLGVVHLFAVGYMQDMPMASEEFDAYGLYHMEYRQGQWLRPTLIYRDESRDGPMWPQATVGLQNEIHLTWFVYYDRFDERLPPEGAYSREVFYSRRAPTLPNRPTQAFEPTITPPPTEIAFQQFAATSTPFPTVEPVDPTIDVHQTSDLYAIQTVLMALFGGAIVCGIVLLAVGFRPRWPS